MYWTLVSSLDFCLISSLFFNFYCMTANVSPPKVRYPVKTINGVSSSVPVTPQVQQQSIPGGQQLTSDIQNIQSDWIKVVGSNGYPIRGNRLNYYNQLSVNSQLPPFPPPPPPPPLAPSSAGLLPDPYFLSSSSHSSLPIYSSSDNQKDNPTDLKPPPQASSSSAWSKVYPSGQSGSVIWPNQVKSLT